MEIDPEMTPRQSSGGRRKSESSLTFQSKGTETQLRPDIDVILSLKNPVYKAVMIGYFQRLGSKKTNNKSNEAEKEIAREALQLFKNRKRGEQTRFFKPESRYSSKSYLEVDETEALEKITADIYRRMESAKRWMTPENTADDDDSTRKNPPPQDPGTSQQKEIPTFEDETGKKLPIPAATNTSHPPLNIPTQQTTSTKPPPPKSAKKNKKRKLLKKVPQSLPFLSNTNVADIIVEEELRAKKTVDSSKDQSPNDQIWQHEEVINFFRALYVHGWGEWKKVSKMVKTRNNQHIKSYAMKLEKKFPELRKFFSSKQVHKMQEKHGVKVKRYGSGSAKSTGGMANKRMVASQNDPAMIAASVMGTMKHMAAAKRPTKPKVVICLGDHIIDTEAEPSLIQPSNSRKRSADTLPDYFDPSVRPSIPTNSQQIYIPGNKVHARWLNKDDPGSYGTWYPGFVNASKIAPIQDEYNYTGIPSLLYHVKFEDGAESLDLDTEDMMMQDQYQVWLKDLEQYYSLRVTEAMTWKRLTKNARVYAKWIDPTDPELHGSWMSGKVHSSKTWEDDANQWRHSYHILFDNGDQDADLLDGDVMEEETHRRLLGEKMERGRKKSRLSGFDLIAEASKISSPIKTGPDQNVASKISSPIKTGPTPNETFTAGSAKKKLYSEDSSDDDSLMEELRCMENLESRIPSPTHVARLSSTPSPDVHYGIYMKAKPWQVNSSLGKNTSAAPQDRSKSFTYASSNGPSQECDLNSTDASKTHTNKTNNSVPQDKAGSKPLQSQECDLDGISASNNAETKHPDEDSKVSPKSQVESNTNPPEYVSAGDSQALQVETKNQVKPGSKTLQSQECDASNNAETKHPDEDSKVSPKSQVQFNTNPPGHVPAGDSQELQVKTKNQVKPLMPESIANLPSEKNPTHGLSGTDNTAAIATSQPCTADKSTEPAAAEELTIAANQSGTNTTSMVAQELINTPNPTEAVADNNGLDNVAESNSLQAEHFIED